MSTKDRRAVVGWLLYCANQGYLSAKDREGMHNWFLDDESTLTARDIELKNDFLGMAGQFLHTEPLSDRDNLRMIIEHMQEYGGQLTLFCRPSADGDEINDRWGGGYHFGSETDLDGVGDPDLAAGAAYGMGATPDLVLHQIADTLGVH